jgi:hypothetical protein
VESALTRPPLPKLAWLAATVALSLRSPARRSSPCPWRSFLSWPGIGILRRNIWSARGFALFHLCGAVLVLFLSGRTTLTSADRSSLIASVFLTLLLVTLFS